MLKLRYMLTGMLLCIGSILSAQNLDEYLEQAAESNPGLKAKYAEFEAAMQKAAGLKSLPDPTLSFGYFISPVETRVGPQRARFSLSQMFPWFGTLAAGSNVAALMAEAKYSEFLNSRNELYYKVKAAWYPLYELDNMLRLQKENLKILNTYKEIATVAFKNGKSAMADVIRVDIMIENAEAEIKILEAKRMPLLVNFNNLLNRPNEAPVVTPDSLPPLQLSANYRKDSLLNNHPAIAAYELRAQSAEAEEKLANKQGLPRFGVGLDYVIVDERQDVTMDMKDNGKDVIMPMVSLTLPVFRGKYNASVKEAKYKQTAIAESTQEFVNSLESAYEMTFFELDKADRLIALYHEQMGRTRQTIDLLITAYSNYGRDFIEVLRMQQELLKYQMAEVTAKKEAYIALAKLDYLTAKAK